MPINLSSLILTKQFGGGATEDNLEQGRIYAFTPTAQVTTMADFCWIAPGNGTAVIEIWGASGSSSNIGCCGGGIPGNPGGYAKKTITVTNSSYVCGTVGMSCGNANQTCYRGRSLCTNICFSGTGVGGSGPMIAQGGRSGVSICLTTTGTSIYCCFGTAGLPITQAASAGCGIICNYCASEIAGASGGDVNCPGGFSCRTYYHCNPCCACSIYDHVQTSAGIFSTQGNLITLNYDADSDYSAVSGQTAFNLPAALNALSKSPNMGMNMNYCWNGQRGCGCYEQHGCVAYIPHGVPGTGVIPCGDVCDVGLRGGHGSVRIKFIGT
jgi:hypothetical protein